LSYDWGERLWDAGLTILTVIPFGGATRHTVMFTSGAMSASFAMAAVEIAPVREEWRTPLRFAAGLVAGFRGAQIGNTVVSAFGANAPLLVSRTRELASARTRMLELQERIRMQGGVNASAELIREHASLAARVRILEAHVTQLRALGGQSLLNAEEALNVRMRELADLETQATSPGLAPSARRSALSSSAIQQARQRLREATDSLQTQFREVDRLASASLASPSTGTFRPITNPDEVGLITMIQGDIEIAAGALPQGATSWWQPNMMIQIADEVRPLLTNRNLMLLSRDLGREVALVERGGRLYLHTGSSSTRARILITAGTARVVHTHPSGPILSELDIIGFSRVTNNEAIFQIVVETISGRTATVTYTRAEIQTLFQLSGDAQRQAARQLAIDKLAAQGLTLH
jgi:hypothetical protein